MRGTEKTVPLLKELFGSHIDNIQHSLSLTSQRHAMLSQNLANLNTPNYRRKDMDFNLVLEDEMKGPDRIKKLMNQLRGPDMFGEHSAGTNGNDVDLEKEVMSIAETELRYQALTDFAAGYFSNLKNVIREGR
jgi:flagellar basal-body rod protein FlgB